MCMLAILRDMADGWPVILAANREEFYDRQGTPPEVWTGSPAMVAGRDPRAGGTWLGVNEYGLLLAVTNRPKEQVPHEPRSRGLLCVELLGCRSAEEAHDRAVKLSHEDTYAGCNILAIDRTATFLVESGDTVVTSSPGAGVHIVTAFGLDKTSDARAALARAELLASPTRSIEDWLERLTRICGRHAFGQDPPICLHAGDRGTISSSIVALGAGATNLRWLHAQGPPCRMPFVDYSLLFQGLAIHPKSAAPVWAEKIKNDLTSIHNAGDSC